MTSTYRVYVNICRFLWLQHYEDFQNNYIVFIPSQLPLPVSQYLSIEETMLGASISPLPPSPTSSGYLHCSLMVGAQSGAESVVAPCISRAPEETL